MESIPWKPFSEETYNELSDNNKSEVLCETDTGYQMHDGYLYIDNDVNDDLEEGWTPIAIARLHPSKFTR